MELCRPLSRPGLGWQRGWGLVSGCGKNLPHMDSSFTQHPPERVDPVSQGGSTNSLKSSAMRKTLTLFFHCLKRPALQPRLLLFEEATNPDGPSFQA